MRKFFLQQNDNRTNYIKQKLQEKGKVVLDFEPNVGEITKDDVVIVTPAFKWTSEIAQKIPRESIVFGGMFRDDIKNIIEQLNYHNFMLDEDFVLKNATYTAEGFLADLILNTKSSLFDQKILILGSGRVAKAVQYILHKLSVPFDVAMRNEKEVYFAKLLAKKAFYLDDLKVITKDYDTIINTIPFEVFEKFDKNDFKKDVVVFELASKKCLNVEKLSEIKYVFCPSIPSKYLGNSAGDLMFQFVLRTIK